MDVIQILADKMGFTLETVAIAIPTSIESNYIPLRTNVADVTLTSANAYQIYTEFNHTEFYVTPTFKESTYSGLVNKSMGDPSAFRLFEPLTMELWGAIAGSMFVAAILIVLIDMILSPKRANGTSFKERSLQLVKASYHTWTALLGGEDYEWLTLPARMLRMSLLFIVLICVSTYTANLAAFFNKPSFQIGGPTTLEELRTSSACTLYGSDVMLAPYVGTVASAPPNVSQALGAQIDFCMTGLRSGAYDVLIYDRPILLNYLFSGGDSGYCHSLSDASWISITPDQWSFALRSADGAFGYQLSAGIVILKSMPEYVNLLSKYFYTGRTCAEGEADDTTPVSLQSMLGLFVLAGAFAILAVAIACMQRLFAVYKVRNSSTDVDVDVVDHTASEGDLLRAILAKVERLEKDIKGESATPRAAQPATYGI